MHTMDTVPASAATAPVLDVRPVVAGYVKGLPIVTGASLHVGAGEVVSILGPNGAGKSTLMKAVAGLVQCESGSIGLRGRSLMGLQADQIMQAGVMANQQDAPRRLRHAMQQGKQVLPGSQIKLIHRFDDRAIGQGGERFQGLQRASRGRNQHHIG